MFPLVPKKFYCKINEEKYIIQVLFLIWTLYFKDLFITLEQRWGLRWNPRRCLFNAHLKDITVVCGRKHRLGHFREGIPFLMTKGAHYAKITNTSASVWTLESDGKKGRAEWAGETLGHTDSFLFQLWSMLNVLRVPSG